MHGQGVPRRGGLRGPEVDLVRPADGTVLERVRLATVEDAHEAVAAASRARAPLAAMPLADRVAALRALVDALDSQADALAALITDEMGCPVRQCRLLQVDSAVALLRATAGLAEAHRFTEERQGLRGGRTRVTWLPVGVVAGIVPWNVPLFLACMKLAPALATGCPIVLKPAPSTAASGLRLAEAVAALDLPAGSASVLPGDADVGEALVGHPDVAKVSFTGSTAVGRRVGARCGERLASCTLELGGKGAAVLLDDVDLDARLGELVNAMCFNSGQICGAQTRVLVPAARAGELVDRLAGAVGALRVGDPRDPATDVGPLAGETQRRRVQAMVDAAVAGGARVLGRAVLPPETAGGAYVAPVLLEADPGAAIAREEVFGPVVVVHRYRDEDEAVALANGTPYGLTSSVWGEDPDRLDAVASRLRSGTVAINSRRILDWGSPFGGVGASGMGRELGPEGLDAHLEPRTTLVPAG